MKSEDLSAIQLGAKLQGTLPYFEEEVNNMQNAIVNSVLTAVNNGALTPDMAMSKWMEYIALRKLQQKFNQRIEIGKSVGAQIGSALDFKS